MVYGAALEMRFGGNSIEGSNPSLSATDGILAACIRRVDSTNFHRCKAFFQTRTHSLQPTASLVMSCTVPSRRRGS